MAPTLEDTVGFVVTYLRALIYEPRYEPGHEVYSAEKAVDDNQTRAGIHIQTPNTLSYVNHPVPAILGLVTTDPRDTDTQDVLGSDIQWEQNFTLQTEDPLHGFIANGHGEIRFLMFRLMPDLKTVDCEVGHLPTSLDMQRDIAVIRHMLELAIDSNIKVLTKHGVLSREGTRAAVQAGQFTFSHDP